MENAPQAIGFVSTWLSYISVSLVSSVLGFVIGYFLGRRYDGKVQALNPFNLVLIVITTIFSMSMILSFINPNYQTSPFLYGLMASVVGFFFKPQPK